MNRKILLLVVLLVYLPFSLGFVALPAAADAGADAFSQEARILTKAQAPAEPVISTLVRPVTISIVSSPRYASQAFSGIAALLTCFAGFAYALYVTYHGKLLSRKKHNTSVLSTNLGGASPPVFYI